MITPEGWCTTCHHHVTEYPDYVCPWCDDANPRDEGSPEEVWRQIRQTTLHLKALKAQRGQMARAALEAGEARALAKRMHVGVTRVRGWARYGMSDTCIHGHNREKHGWQTTDGTWSCAKCIEGRKKNWEPERDTPSARRRAWERVEAKEAERLKALGERPARLLPLLPPFGDE